MRELLKKQKMEMEAMKDIKQLEGGNFEMSFVPKRTPKENEEKDAEDDTSTKKNKKKRRKR